MLALRPGRHLDGGGSRLRGQRPRSTSTGTIASASAARKPELSIGPYPKVGLAEARAKHAQLRANLLNGKDPGAGRRRDGPTLSQRAKEKAAFVVLKQLGLMD